MKAKGVIGKEAALVRARTRGCLVILGGWDNGQVFVCG